MQVRVEDVTFIAYVDQRELTPAPAVEGDTFLRPLLQRMAERLAHFPAADGQLPGDGVRLGYIEDPAPNASVELFGQVAVICLNTGLLLNLLEAAVQLQDAVGAFDPDFGGGVNVASEVELDAPLGLSGFLAQFMGAPADDRLFGAQQDPDAPATRRAMRFMAAGVPCACLPEFGQVANGHLAWLAAAGGPARLWETAVPGEPPTGDLGVRRFFEHEADVFALEILIRTAIVHGRTETRGSVVPHDEVVLVMLAFLVTAHTWMALEQAIGREEDGAHPDPEERLLALPMALIGLLDKDPSLKVGVEQAINRCRLVLTHAVRRYPRFRPLAAIFTPAKLERLDAVIGWMRRMDVATLGRHGTL